jgi:hypothetical protein
VRPEILKAVEGAVNALAMESQVQPATLLRDVFVQLGAEAEQSWPARGLPGLHEAPFLLAFVRQLAQQGWSVAQGLSLPRKEVARPELRGLRVVEATRSASHRRGLDEQRAGERSDALRLLSCLLARHTQEAWGDAYKTYAEIGWPLAHGASARVGRLRAYGNAIVAPAAQAFVEAVMECRP